MGSFKGSKRNQGPDRRRGKGLRPRDLLRFESLESRTLLDATTPSTVPPPWHATTTDLSDVKNGPMADAGTDLIGIYQAFQNGGNPNTAYPRIKFQGNSVGVDVQGFGDFASFQNTLQNVGMQVTATDPTREIVEGYLPISALPTVAQNPQTVDLHAIYKPSYQFVGTANNEAEASMNANVARQINGVDGTGVTIGVLSDSVNRFAGGLADSVRTGDLPANVNVIQDGPAGSTDEGRAMLENIRDIAPGANLAFATADNGEVSFAANIRSLATTAGARVINDDVGYPTEPMFQDGIVAQAVIDVTNQNGVSYFAAAHNSANHGYVSQFRGVNATPGSLTAGQYMNFNPGTGVTTLLPITTGPTPGAGGLVFQFDQPWYTTAGVTSDLDIYVLDSAGAVVARSVSNNVATQQPFEFIDLSAAAPNTQYFVAIQLVSGQAPAHVGFMEIGDNVLNSVSQQFGTAGGTFYATTFGHPTSASAIGVGAVPWWGTDPSVTPAIPPVLSEPFSSFGPALIEFNSLGLPLTSPQLRQKPDISAPDGGNTSFFPPGGVIQTNNPPFPGEPATPSNLSQNLPSFFGTSSATPNAAAVAALMLQKSPSATPTDIRNALIASAFSLNGAPTGTWNAQGGFGEVNAVKALSNIAGLQVLSTTPANGQTIASAPGSIVVTFNRPVDIKTVSASDLVFTGTPQGTTAAAVGTPIPLDNPQFPTMVAFPITINSPPGVVANGVFTYVVQGPILAQDGKPLIASAPITFNLNDTIAPRVTNTTINGRVITVQFSEPMRPSTITAGNFQLIRAGSAGSFGKPSNVNLSTDPRLKISYDPTTNTATLDYSALDQAQFPSDQYALVVLAGDNGGPGVTDLAGNFLDGEPNATFPSGDGDPKTPQNPSGRSGSERFTQFLGFRTLSAPVITSLQLSSQSDTGIKGDSNTSSNRPVFIGQVAASFPGTISGLTVHAEFNGLHGGTFDLAPGGGGRGFVGHVDFTTTTDVNGTFTIQAPFLPEGFNSVRVVVVGQPDQPPLPGFSSALDQPFRIDRTGPTVIAATLTQGGTALPLIGTNLANLTTISLDVVDPSLPTNGPLSTPPQINFPALDPATATNLNNYTLVNLDTGIDESAFIASARFTQTGSDFVSPPGRTTTFDPFSGRVDLTFNQGLPAGHYALTAHTSERIGGVTYNGLRDAAGNALDNSSATGSVDFQLGFTIQNQATFITNLQAVSSYNGLNSTVVGGPRSFYELPAPGATPRASAPPTAFVIDFANPLDPAKDYTTAVQLIASADNLGGTPDGDFGTLGEGGLGSTGTGFTVVPGTTVTLADKTTGALLGQPGFSQGDRLVLRIAAGTTLGADHYRLYMPNTGANAIFDIYGNQFDGEFLGDPNGIGGYEDLMPNGQYRAGLSGDGVGGGAFTTGFVVVPNGNVVYARPDYSENPLNPSTAPDGSLAKPYAALAPEVNPATAPTNPTNDPNGGQNATSNFFNFNTAYDRNGNGHFDRSALYAAQQLATRGPVVLVALPATPSRDPLTGQVTQQTFVLQAPSGSSATVNNGSASVPFDTMLVFQPGSALKLQNASLYVQNQGSSLQLNGGPNPNDQVNFTSWADASVGGKTNGAFGKSTPSPGDWGGIVFRNFDNVSNGRNLQFPIDGSLQGAGGGKAISGADDALSVINFANVRYSGGSVPQTQGTPTSGITLFNSRPAITNVNIANSGVTTNGTTVGGVNLVAAISADFDSFREDDTARGPLIRKVNVAQNSLNGILIRPNSSGVAEATDAILYPSNPTTLGGARNYTFDDPLPILLTSQLYIGQQLLQNTGGQTAFVNARLYVQPGMMVKSLRGAGIAVVNNDASINIGSRTYINQFDANPNISPSDPNFKANPTTDARVLFTSLYDFAATTSYFDPSTGQTTTIVPKIDSANSNGANQPTPGNVPTLARWGSLSIQSGAVGSINDAEFRYGGGAVIGPELTFPNQSVLAFITNDTPLQTPLNTQGFGATGTRLDELGAHVMVTDNNFFDNIDAAMQIEPNGLMAGDPLRPLLSGHPFFRNNVMQRNDIDGMAVVSSDTLPFITNPSQPLGRRELPLGSGQTNLTVNSVWDSTDLTYVLRGSIVLAGAYDRQRFRFVPGQGFVFAQDITPDPNQFTAEKNPFLTLTLQSALPGTLLADGTSIGRPGEPLLVKTMNDYTPWGAGALDVYGATGNNGSTSASTNAGAGFIVGYDDGVDPPTTPFSPLVDPGAGSQIRIVGIPGDETTGQQRVPVTITSLRDGSIGKSVRGVNMTSIWNNNPLNPTLNLTTPAPGDGGKIAIGGNSLTDYNLLDPRDGSLIDNADIRYMTRIEIQGGGIIDLDNTPPPPGTFFPPTFQDQKLGQTPKTQFNSEMAMTISNSNLAYFSDAAVFAHADSANALIRDLTTLGTPTAPGAPAPVFLPVRDTNSDRGQGVVVFMYGDTISNSDVGVEVHSDQVAPEKGNNPESLILLNNTFYNDAIGLHTNGYGPPNTAPDNHVYWLALDNIFANSSDTAIIADGYNYSSQAQYNLFWQNSKDLTVTLGVPSGFLGNVGAIIGNPDFRDPNNGNFQLGPNSAAIDASRSEIGPLPGGDAIYPTVTQVLDALGNPTSASIRTDPATLTPPATPGRSDPNGGLQTITDPRKIVELPGVAQNSRGFFDAWIPVLTSDPSGTSGPASNSDTYNYTPVVGVRDALGFLRQDDPNVPNVGFGNDPFYDIGAFEHRLFFPPVVTAVTATVADPTSGTGFSSFNIYNVGGIGGTNQTPQSISFQLNENLDPNTISNASVRLEASGGDGIFGNGNSPSDRFIDLSGKLSFDPATNVLTIHLGDAGLALGDDEYRVFLEGNGSDVLRDPQGNALDGENTASDDPNNPQLALPSGDGFPGGNFYLTFTINTTPAQITPGTFTLSPTSDTNVRDYITYNNMPTFTGTISVTNPAINPVGGQIVVVDVSTRGDGVFDRLNAGTGVTNALGNFTVTVGIDAAGTGLVTNTTPLPDSPYNVGFDGLLNSPANQTLNPNGSFDDVNYSIARVRVLNGGGASSISNPNAFTGLAVDTNGPVVTDINPVAGSLLQADATGNVNISFTVNKNVDPASLNSTSILVNRAGPDGVLGTPDDVSVPINTSSLTITPLRNGAEGPERISFTLSGGLVNDLYALTLKGTGATPITDIAGNPLGGTGGGAGQDVTTNYGLFSTTSSHTIFVGAGFATNSGASQGSRANPFPTITEGLAAASQGDVVAVLPGVYTESINLKSLVKLVSADTISNDGTVVPGNALQTIIRAPGSATGSTTTVSAVGLFSVPGLETEIRGFTIASPLLVDPATGPIDFNSVGLRINNSNMLVDKNYFIDSGFGIAIETSGLNAAMPRIVDDVLAGNATGLLINDIGTTTLPTNGYAQINNDTFAFNTFGILANVSSDSPLMAQIANSIFWENHDQSTARNGAGIIATVSNKLVARFNLFKGNGPQENGSAYAGIDVGNGFVASKIGSTPDSLGNFSGNPAFVAPRDPRPGSDGPGAFFTDANFDLTLASAAIDTANNGFAPSTDFLTRNRVKISGRGFPGTGPADVGAFEFQGTGGVPVGGAFRVVTTSLAPGGAVHASGQTFTSGPRSVVVVFSGRVDPNSVSPNDLILRGSGLNNFYPAKASSLTWIDDHTVRFNLTGGYKLSGQVSVTIPQGAVKSLTSTPILGYADTFKVNNKTVTTRSVHSASLTTAASTTIAPSVAVPYTPPSLTPAPAAPPTTAKHKLFSRLSLRRKGH